MHASIKDTSNLNEVYPDGRVGCVACHPEGNYRGLNPFGKAYHEAGRDIEALTAIEAKDSDGDGVDNKSELKASTNPGDAKDK